MAKLSKRLFFILTISYVINQFSVNSQSTNNVTSNGQISNLTFSSILSYTSQPSITSNQTTVTINNSLPFSTTRVHSTTPAFIMITRFPLIILTLVPVNRTIHVTTITTVTSQNLATKCEQYITLLISVHFLLFIFPIH